MSAVNLIPQSHFLGLIKGAPTPNFTTVLLPIAKSKLAPKEARGMPSLVLLMSNNERQFDFSTLLPT